MKQKVGENTLGLEGGVAESRGGPWEGPASEGGTEWRERPASGEAAAAEAGEPHGHGGFKLSGGRASERWPWPVAVLASHYNPPNSGSRHKTAKYLPLRPGLNPIQLLFSGPTGPVDKELLYHHTR
jgi:hypothetical protein